MLLPIAVLTLFLGWFAAHLRRAHRDWRGAQRDVIKARGQILEHGFRTFAIVAVTLAMMYALMHG